MRFEDTNGLRLSVDLPWHSRLGSFAALLASIEGEDLKTTRSHVQGFGLPCLRKSCFQDVRIVGVLVLIQPRRNPQKLIEKPSATRTSQ